MGRWDEKDGATATPNNETSRCPIGVRNMTTFLYLRFSFYIYPAGRGKKLFYRHISNKNFFFARQEKF